MRIISIYPNFANKGGAQDIALCLAKKMNKDQLPIILTETPFQEIEKEYRIGDVIFEKFSIKNILRYADNETVFISHHRKNTSLLVLLKHILGKKLLIHVAHNIFTNLKLFSLFPENVIAVSSAVKENLIQYFKLSPRNVKVIYNGLEDSGENRNVVRNDGIVKILLPGRICNVKRQIEIVKKTREKLLEHINIYFAGVGSDADKLKLEIGVLKQYHYLGYINIKETLNQYDYVCLFSQKEGFPLSLIEGCMFGKPLITNNIPSVLDINDNGQTGFVFSDFESFVEGCNNLPLPNSNEYIRLSMNARMKYKEKFTEDRMISEYKQVVEFSIKNRY